MTNDKESTSTDAVDPEALVAVFSSSNHDAEMEAVSIKGVLDSSGITAVVVGPHVLPNLEFQVQVPQNLLEDARAVIRDARQGGRQAADEAEKATEG